MGKTRRAFGRNPWSRSSIAESRRFQSCFSCCRFRLLIQRISDGVDKLASNACWRLSTLVALGIRALTSEARFVIRVCNRSCNECDAVGGFSCSDWLGCGADACLGCSALSNRVQRKRRHFTFVGLGVRISASWYRFDGLANTALLASNVRNRSLSSSSNVL